MDTKQLKDEVAAGRIDSDRLIDIIVAQQKILQALQDKVSELERKLRGDDKFEEPFSVREEEKRQAAKTGNTKQKKTKPIRKGRLTSKYKLEKAVRTEKVYPPNVDQTACVLSHTRPVWRLENGQAVIVAYEVYRSGNSYGRIPGTLGRSEFGIEFVLAIAYQVYVLGLSFDKVCALQNFFQGLPLTKSQVDALLTQLSRRWLREFDTLCTLLANSLVVNTDETSWSINSVWAFFAENARVVFFGVRKDAATLAKILDPTKFAGLVISDHAAVYSKFTNTQKCWAHLLRKAIKLTLREPSHVGYRQFVDRLLGIYREACRIQGDKRLCDEGRARKVAELDDQVLQLCAADWFAELPKTEGAAEEYRLLINELMKLHLSRELFAFVTTRAINPRTDAPIIAGGTNNEAERGLRPSLKLARRAARIRQHKARDAEQSFVVCWSR